MSGCDEDGQSLVESAAALMRPWTRASAVDGEHVDEVVADDDLQRRVDEQMRRFFTTGRTRPR
jgi:hypothetical protein